MDSDMFEAERGWLQDQLGMNPWMDGCRRLSQQIDGWIDQYGPPYCDQPLKRQDPNYGRFSFRLWQCWSWHWSNVAVGRQIDGQVVAQRLCDGQDGHGTRSLGGNPLRDVVLAVAMRCKHNQAAAAFEKEYRELCRGRAAAISTQAANELEQWWNDLLDHLAGYLTDRGKLDKYAGRSSLSRWLRPVVWNFLRDWFRRNKRDWPFEPNDSDDPSAMDGCQQLEQDECRPLIRSALAHAVAQLEKHQRLVLYLRHLDQMQWQQIGPILGVDKGTANRRHQRILEQLENLVLDYLERHFGHDSADRRVLVAEAIQTDRQALAAVLWQILKQAKQDDEPSESTDTGQEPTS